MDGKKRKHSEIIGSADDKLLPDAKRFKGEGWVVVEDWLAFANWLGCHSLISDGVQDPVGDGPVGGGDVPVHDNVLVNSDNEVVNHNASVRDVWWIVSRDDCVGFGDGVELMEVEDGDLYSCGMLEESIGIEDVSFGGVDLAEGECSEHDDIFICEDCLCFAAAIAGESGDFGSCKACMKKKIRSSYVDN